PLRLVINSPYFPGWTVLVDGRAVTPTVIPVSAYMEISVPAGSHRLEARLENTTLRAAANAMTLTGALIWIALAVRSVRQHVTGRAPGRAGHAGGGEDFGAVASRPSI